jgi:asparagine synthase (glutamine-hydrolysing)
MCGICGIIGLPREAAIERVKRMCRTLAHRGPDDEHVVAGDNWAFGQRRLSVIDLSINARQPFVNEDGSCVLTSNGEIYNFRDLRRPLVNAGHRFVSSSDCEVILHLMEEDGESGLLKLNGMYAFAFLDQRRRKVMLCRDRLGIKPLYYRRTPEALLFASEIKALVENGKSGLRQDRIQEFFQYRYVSGSDTLFQDIQEVLPGHRVSIDLDNLSIEDRAYWVPRVRKSTGAPVDEAALARELEQAVARQLVSDVPLGCQLSGGLDSSLVTQMALHQTDHRMHTFSVGFAGYEKDESAWARQVGRALDTIHHPIPYTEREFLEDLALGAYLHDEPLNHANSLPMYKLCREARKHVTVLLTGEGADELFSGYSWHRRLWRLGEWGRGVHWPITGWLARTFGPRRLDRILPLLGKSPREMAIQAGKWVSDECLGGLLTSYSPVDNPYRNQMAINEHLPLAAILDMDLRTYLVSVLQRQDRMSMASGVESRVPFLDHDLVEQVLQIPVDQHFENGRGKAVLRHIARGRIPDEILDRPKTGFSLPLIAWMRNPRGLGGLLDWLSDERASSRGIWKQNLLNAKINEHRQGTHNHSDLLWSALSFELWARIWLDGISHGQLKDQILTTVDRKT